MSCECKVCKDINRWKLLIQSDDLDERMLAFNEMFDRIENAETDVARFESIFKGDWPSAEIMLQQALDDIRNKNVANISDAP